MTARAKKHSISPRQRRHRIRRGRVRGGRLIVDAPVWPLGITGNYPLYVIESGGGNIVVDRVALLGPEGNVVLRTPLACVRTLYDNDTLTITFRVVQVDQFKHWSPPKDFKSYQK